MTDTIARKDPLVFILRGIIGFLIGTFAFAMIMLVVGMVTVPFTEARIVSDLTEQGIQLTGWQAIAMIEVLIVTIGVLLGLMIWFLLQLWRVLATVRRGDPFDPVNAVRLTRMAWIAVAGHAWGFVLGIYVHWLEGFMGDEFEDADLNFSFGAGGLVLILVLFVLARVFRKGTEMREELEGTV